MLPIVAPRHFWTGLSRFGGFHRWNSSSTNFNLISKKRLGVFGAPLDRGQVHSGTEHGPDTCRKSGFSDVLKQALNWDIKDYGNLDFGLSPRTTTPDSYIPTSGSDGKPVPPKNLQEVASANKKISDKVVEILRDDRLSLCLGGDHSIAIGSVHGTTEVYSDLAVLWVDAHADINTNVRSLTGNMHGMPASFIIKEMEPFMEKHPEFSWLEPRLHANNIAYIGLRDVDFSEKLLGQYNRSAIEQLGIQAYSMKEVDQFGIRACVQMALEKISPGGCRPVHLSFDIDSLDDREVTNTGTAVAGGLTLREGHIVLEEVHKSGLMVAMDLVEVNPKLGTQEGLKRTVRVVRQLLSTAFGYYRGGVSGGRRLVSLRNN